MSTERLETLTKWRQVYVMLDGSSPMGHERYIRNEAEANLLHRVELSALAQLLIQKGVFTGTEFAAQVEIESQELCKKLEKSFPGFSATSYGLKLDTAIAAKTVQSWSQPYGFGAQTPPKAG